MNYKFIYKIFIILIVIIILILCLRKREGFLLLSKSNDQFRKWMNNLSKASSNLNKKKSSSSFNKIINIDPKKIIFSL